MSTGQVHDGYHILDPDESIGYAVQLPGDARFAVRFQLTLEEWATLPVIATAGKESADAAVVDYRAVSQRLYGLRTGIYRLLDVMDEAGCVASVTTCGLCGDRWPSLVADIARRGHEVVGHAYSQDVEMAIMSEEDDLGTVRRTAAALEMASGYRPVGWASAASRRGPFTVKSLLREGFIYTNDFREADFPFVVARMGNRRLVAMPRTDEINDNYALHNAGHSPGNYVDYFKRSFDRLYKESQSQPGRVLTAVCHATIMGHPWGASALAECCEYTKQHEDVWQATSRQIAEHYLTQLGAGSSGRARQGAADAEQH